MILDLIRQNIAEGLKSLFDADVDINTVKIEKTRKDIEGDFTVNVFPFVRFARKSPEQTAEALGQFVQEKVEHIQSFNVIKGFLNFELSNGYWFAQFAENHTNDDFGYVAPDETEKPIVVEYSSPNTNKPMHLGHIRNNLLGYSIAEILEASGKHVKKVNLVNDRGIHICKSMKAWELWGKGETPDIAGKKGDHFVGDYYVMFDKAFKTEVKRIVEKGTIEENAVKQSVLMQDARKMLQDWEAGDDYTTKLWIKMNEWVCSGFDETYTRLGVNFDKVYYESDTYLLGKDIVAKGLEDGVLVQKEDNSVWIDLREEGLDEKLLLRADGTSVYMTQDLGTADLRLKDFGPKELLYVVGDEQNYHFQVLKLSLKKLGYEIGDDITHISYGMVELPEGKMKSREGNVVDADDLMNEMHETAKQLTTELGKASELSQEEAETLFETIGLGALKYFMLKVDPKKKMMFNPKESIDFNGNTGPFIQYTYARIRSMVRKGGDCLNAELGAEISLHDKEKELLAGLTEFPQIVQQAAAQFSPAIIANYVYDIAKSYNSFYHDCPVLKADDENVRCFRLQLSNFTSTVLRQGMKLLGVTMPEQM